MVKHLVELLKVSAYNLYRATLVGNPAPFVAELYAELSNPQAGDLVMEVTTHGMKDRNPLEGIGRLVQVVWESPYKTRQEAWADGYEDNEELPTQKYWDITLDFDDGRPFRWENAMFIKVKETDSLSL